MISDLSELTQNVLAGWKVVLSPRVPTLAAGVVHPTFTDLLASLPNLPKNYKEAADFDWALHPGGATILSGVERAMKITPEHMRASYDTYINHGNSSSATIISVMNRLRMKDMDALAPGGEGKVKEFVIGCAFGPGITIEMCMMKRNLGHSGRRIGGKGMHSSGISGEVTPPETESEGSRSEGEADTEADSLSEALNGVELD
jgi:type III polyketide synthase